jgi:Na+/proline symporter
VENTPTGTTTPSLIHQHLPSIFTKIVTYFLLSVLVLAAMLFIPVSNLIYTFSVRRLQRREQRELEDNELIGQRRRARFVTLFVATLFALLFNISLLGNPLNG